MKAGLYLSEVLNIMWQLSIQTYARTTAKVKKTKDRPSNM